MNTNTAIPTPKVAAAGIGGAASVVLVWLMRAIWSLDVPPEVAAALATLLAFGAGYLKKPANDDAGQVSGIEALLALGLLIAILIFVILIYTR